MGEFGHFLVNKDESKMPYGIARRLECIWKDFWPEETYSPFDDWPMTNVQFQRMSKRMEKLEKGMKKLINEEKPNFSLSGDTANTEMIPVKDTATKTNLLEYLKNWGNRPRLNRMKSRSKLTLVECQRIDKTEAPAKPNSTRNLESSQAAFCCPCWKPFSLNRKEKITDLTNEKGKSEPREIQVTMSLEQRRGKKLKKKRKVNHLSSLASVHESANVITHGLGCRCDLCVASQCLANLPSFPQSGRSDLIRIGQSKQYVVLMAHGDSCRCSMCAELELLQPKNKRGRRNLSDEGYSCDFHKTIANLGCDSSGAKQLIKDNVECGRNMKRFGKDRPRLRLSKKCRDYHGRDSSSEGTHPPLLNMQTSTRVCERKPSISSQSCLEKDLKTEMQSGEKQNSAVRTELDDLAENGEIGSKSGDTDHQKQKNLLVLDKNSSTASSSELFISRKMKEAISKRPYTFCIRKIGVAKAKKVARRGSKRLNLSARKMLRHKRPLSQLERFQARKPSKKDNHLTTTSTDATMQNLTGQVPMTSL